jgi:WD40 repeat protein
MNSSGRVRVLVGTSEGPVEILWLRREAQAVRRSQVTIGDSTRDAGISRGYDAFVARRTGVIQRLFDGARAYRAEVAAKIDAGSSWQLGFFVAHALAASGRFANAEQARSVTLWATGQVRTDDLSVGAIGYLARKLTSSVATLKAAAAAGERVIVAFPVGNADQPGASLRNELVSIGAEIIEAETIIDVVRKLDLPAIALAADAFSRPWTGSPFLGLEAFQPQHRDVFFGRDRAREEALERLRNAAKGEFAFLLIHGRSGCGKSSLARAGLLGDVAIQASEADVWRSCILSPGLGSADPLASLIAAFANVLPEFSASLLHAARDALVTLVGQALADSVKGKTCKLLLVVDQLEELLIGDSAGHREAFAETIAALAASGAVLVVTTLRSDLLPLIEESPALSRLCSDDRQYRLERPNRSELRDIIRRPAAAAGLRFEGNDSSGQPLAEVLIDAAAASLDSLPLLQFVLARMFAIEGSEGRLSYGAYARLGRLEGAIGQWAEDTVAGLISSGISESVIDQVLLGLGRVERDTGAVVARLDEAHSAASERQHVIEAFRRARLIVLDESGRPRVAHEAVLTHWSRAKSLFMVNAHEVELRDLIEAEAAKWQRENRHLEFLIPAGPRIAEADLLATCGRILLSNTAKHFVEASIAESRRLAEEDRRKLLSDLARQRRTTRLAFAAVAAIAVLGAFAFAFGYVAEDERNSALLTQSRFLARESRIATDDGDATLGKLLAVRALPENLAKSERPFLADAEASLEYAFDKSREILQLQGHRTMQVRISQTNGAIQYENVFTAGSIDYALYSPDGSRIATSSGDGTVRIWDAQTGKQTALIETFVGRVSYISFLPDGRLLVLTDSRAPEIRDPASGALLKRLEGGNECVIDVSSNRINMGGIRVGPDSSDASPEGGRIVTVSGATVCLWDASGARISVIRAPGKIRFARLSRHGDRLVVANDQGLGALIDAKNGKILVELGKQVSDAKFSHNGTLLAVGSFDKTATIRDAIDGRVLATLTGHEGPIRTLDFSPDDLTLATGSDDRTVRLWITTDGQPRMLPKSGRREAGPAVFKHQNGLESVTFGGDGTHILAVAGETEVKLWDADRGWDRDLTDDGQKTTIAKIAPDGREVVTYSDTDKSLRIWNGSSDPIAIMKTHGVAALSISPDGKRVVSGDKDGIGQVWTTEEKRPSAFRWVDHHEAVSSVQFTGSDLIVTTGGSSISIRNPSTGELVGSMKQDGVGKIRQALLGTDDRLLMTLTDWGTMRVWNLSTRQQIVAEGDGDVRAEEAERISKEQEQRDALRSASDSGTRQEAGEDAEQQPEESLDRPLAPAEVRIISSRDRRFAAALAIRYDPRASASIDIRDLRDGSEYLRIGGWHGSPTAAAFADDARLFAVGFADGTVTIADIPSRRILGEYAAGVTLKKLPLMAEAVMSVLFSRDNRTLLAGIRDGTVRMLRVADGRITKTMTHESRSGSIEMALSPDGSRLVTTGGVNVKLWDASGELVAQLGKWGSDGAPIFSSDGTRILTNNDAASLLWDSATGREIAALLRRDSSNALRHGFSPDGRYILTTSGWDPNLYLWDGHTGNPLAQLDGAADDAPLRKAAVSPDRRFAVAGSEKGAVMVWRMPARCQALIEQAVASMPRALSRSEMERYFLDEVPETRFAHWAANVRMHIPWLFSRSVCHP